MSALAAASLVAAEGVEPILHVTTRDRNRIALVSEALGAQALGIRNLLCTSGTHQTLGGYRAARNVYDIDSVQLLQTYADLASDGGAVGRSGLDGAGPFCLGAVASPDADPCELQVMRLAKKTRAGAQFLVTQPVFDLERFEAWWQEVTRRGLHETGRHPGGHPAAARRRLGAERPAAAAAEDSRRVGRSRGVARATRLLSAPPPSRSPWRPSVGCRTAGLRGFCISADGDDDVALEILEKSGLGSD